MKKITATLLFVGISTTALVGCTNEETGTAAGAALGAGVGYAVSGGSAAGTLIGAGIGGLTGNAVGQNVDIQNRQAYDAGVNRGYRDSRRRGPGGYGYRRGYRY